MLKKCNNQKGYTLLLTVFIITIFSIFAIVLITIVLSGAKKNAIREDLTQANELTEKGIQHIKNEIHKELNDIIGHGISRSVYLTEIEDLLTLYHCQNTSPENRRITVSSSTGDYIVCVKEWRGANGNKDDLRKEVTFLSKGFVDGKEVEYETTIELGAEDVPDALNYAVGAHRMCINETDCIPGEGNLFMHGGVSIYGDIKVDGDLITYDKGYIYYSDVEEGETWLDSVKPDVRPAPNSNVSRLILGGNVYMMTDEPVSYDQHIKSEDFDRVGYEATKLEDALISVPELFLSDRQPERMEITEHKETFQYDLNDHGVTKVLANLPLKERNYSGAKVFLHRFNYITSGQFTLEGNNRFG